MRFNDETHQVTIHIFFERLPEMPQPGTSCKLLKATVPFVVDQMSQGARNLSVTVTFTFTSAVTYLTNLNFLNVLEFQKQGRNVVHWSHIFTTNEKTKSIKI